VNATTTTTSSALKAQHSVLVETGARTDEEFWQLFGRRITQGNFEKVNRPKTDTSLSLEEWNKQQSFIYTDNKGKHRTIPIRSLSNSEDEGFFVNNSYLRDSSSERSYKSGEGRWPEISIVGSSSLLQTQMELISRQIEVLFRAYAHEDFEDGTESEFINELSSYVLKYGTIAVEVIASIVLKFDIKPQVTFEALRWLGSITHSESYRSRLFLLERSLRNPSRWVRDGAALGLVSMKDVHAVPYIRDAIDREQIQDLRKDLQDVLNRLEHLSHAPFSSKNK